jgi:NACHT domain
MKRPGRRHLLAAHPTRRDGAIALALFLLPWVAAVILVRRHYHLDGGAVGILVAVSLGLPTLWVTWAAYRGPRRAGTSASGLSLAQVADQLAIAVGTQWNDEAAVRRLNDPYPLPVSWVAANASLTDPWDLLVKLAKGGAGRPVPPPAGTWASGPDDLAGKGEELAKVLALVPTGRLVVLGEPGAGKTMLMIRLVLDLLGRRPAGGPVPFLVSIASWNPENQDLRGWLGIQLRTDHPALAIPSPEGTPEPTRADALLASGLILPILDGLDEIPEQIRGSAISRINDALRTGEQVVATCRSKDYQVAVRPEGDVEVTLRAAAAVQLCPLEVNDVRDYLCDDAAGPIARARWEPVFAELGTEAPAGQALRTPLMVGLARAIYNPRPGELTEILRDPAELCNPTLADRSAVESVLFDAFIPAAYRQDPAGRWKKDDAEKWLVFLARHLEYTIRRPDLAWWQLWRAVLFLPLTGVLLGAAALMTSVAVVGISIGTVGLVIQLIGGSPRFSSAASPKAALALARRTAVVAGTLAGVVFGVLFGVIFGVVFGVDAGIWAGIGTAVAAVVIRSLPALWLWYEIARTWLALRRRMPWRLMSFLDDAHRRGVLRQAGAVYQFRHIELQRRLADRDANEQQANSSTD